MFAASFRSFLFAIGLVTLSFFSYGKNSVLADAAKLQQTFPSCLAKLQKQALSAGVTEQTVQQVLAKIKPLPKLLSYDRNQAEFVQTFTGYFSKRVNSWRINQGRKKLAQHKQFLAKLNQQYGVPAHYLIAFWGLETNFGAYKGKVPTLAALATLACDKRRSGYFSAELIQALLLLEREQLEPAKMVGSWAGAMGHTQFMPTAYITYAKDGDGDNKIDLWNNELDALASAANFLKNLGWQAGFRWGREVSLPANFNYQLADKTQPKPLSFWAQQQVKQAAGKPLGDSPISAALLVPAGHKGPAFLVYANFEVILRWNNSEFYGLAVGHLADRIAGQAEFLKPLPELPQYTVAQMQQFQAKLNLLGFDVGEADGILGPATRKGVQQFQQSAGLIADGYPSLDTVEAVMNKPLPDSSSQQSS